MPRFTALPILLLHPVSRRRRGVADRHLADLPALRPEGGRRVRRSLHGLFRLLVQPVEQGQPNPFGQRPLDPGSRMDLAIQYMLRDILKSSAKPRADRATAERELGDYYAACMDDATVDRLGPAALKTLLDHVAHMKKKSDLASVLAEPTRRPST